jgi:hypothetical protein
MIDLSKLDSLDKAKKMILGMEYLINNLTSELVSLYDYSSDMIDEINEYEMALSNTDTETKELSNDYEYLFGSDTAYRNKLLWDYLEEDKIEEKDDGSKLPCPIYNLQDILTLTSEDSRGKEEQDLTKLMYQILGNILEDDSDLDDLFNNKAYKELFACVFKMPLDKFDELIKSFE